jgi:hypothetical protein
MRIPTWDNQVLKSHYQKHPGSPKERDCWKDVLNKPTPVTQDEYKNASVGVFCNAWLEYECTETDRRRTGSYPRSAYYVDDRELKAVTTLDRARFLTCYHKHYNGRHQAGRNAKVPVGERRHEYLKHLEWDEMGGMIKDLRILRNETR